MVVEMAEKKTKGVSMKSGIASLLAHWAIHLIDIRSEFGGENAIGIITVKTGEIRWKLVMIERG